MAVDDICYSYNCRNCAADDRRNEFFDAVCHSFSTTATGGYSTKQASVAYWNSPFIEYVIAIFMILSGINFSLYFMCLKGKGKRLFQDDEFRWFMKSVSILTLVIMFALVFRIIMIGKRHSAGLCFKWLRRIRHAALQRMIITCGHLLHGCFLFCYVVRWMYGVY